MHTQPNVCICLVLYKCELSQSPAWVSLLKALTFAGIEAAIYIHDNSPTTSAMEKEDFHQSSQHYGFSAIKVFTDSSNPGVSLAYNRAAQFASTHNAHWLVLFDQDSTIPEAYFSELLSCTQLYPEAQLIAPPLIDKGFLVSPCQSVWFRGRALKTNLKPGLHCLKGLTLLNSGLAISIQLFNRVGGYKESVPLDFSDFIFIDSCRRYASIFVLLSVQVEHPLSSSSSPSPFAQGQRYAWYLRGAFGAAQCFPARSPLYFFYGCFRFLLLFWRTRFSFAFLRGCAKGLS